MMKMSILTASVLGVIGAAASSAAFADTAPTSTYCTPGFYAGIQGGRSDTFYQPDELLTQAADTGNTTTTVTDSTGTVSSTTTSSTALKNWQSDDSGIGGRVFAGYQFNPYFATELGYTQFAKTDFSANGTTTSTTTNQYYIRNYPNSVTTTNTNYSGDLTEHAIDLVAKGTLPLPYGFGAYVKAGAAYIGADRNINAVTTSSSTTQYNYDGSVYSNSTTTGTGYNSIYQKSYQAFRPTYGTGVSYTIAGTPVSVDLSWTRIQGSGAIPNADLYALGVDYKFA